MRLELSVLDMDTPRSGTRNRKQVLLDLKAKHYRDYYRLTPYSNIYFVTQIIGLEWVNAWRVTLSYRDRSVMEHSDRDRNLTLYNYWQNSCNRKYAERFFEGRMWQVWLHHHVACGMPTCGYIVFSSCKTKFKRHKYSCWRVKL